jgi:hypothetical protein
MRVGEYVERLKMAARFSGFRMGFYGQVGEWALPVLQREGKLSYGHVYLSAGVHGDEPAACLALLHLLRTRALPDDLEYTILPLINPAGLAKGTRNNGQGIDLNRDYGNSPKAMETRQQLAWLEGRSFDLAICLHEDSDGEGFYLYSHFNDESLRHLDQSALESAGQALPVDKRPVIDGMPARQGRVCPPKDLIRPDREDMPEALRLFYGFGVSAVFTTETGSTFPVLDRVAAHSQATLGIIETFLQYAGSNSIER